MKRINTTETVLHPTNVEALGKAWDNVPARARHKRALVRREEERGVGEFVGMRQPQHRRVGGISPANFGRVLR
jgi:hypothetical protein